MQKSDPKAGDQAEELARLRSRVADLEALLEQSLPRGESALDEAMRLDLALAAANAGCWEWNLDTGALVWSPELRAMLGAKPNEIVSYPYYLRHIPESFRFGVEEAVASVLDPGSEEDEYSVYHPYMRPEGRRIWIEARGRVLRHAGGKPRLFVGVAVDRTAEREQDARLDFLDMAFRESPGWQLLADGTGRLLATNRNAERDFGLSGRGLRGLVLADILGGMGSEDFRELMRRLAASRSLRLACTARGRDGAAIPVEALLAWHEFHDGARVHATLHDQHLLMVEREARERSERAFEFLVNRTPLILWEADSTGAVTFCNQHGLDYLGCTLEELVGERWLSVVHPEDKPRVLLAWAEAVRTTTPFRIEYRSRRAATGEFEWHQVAADPMVGPQGRVEKWFGSSTNIEPLKRREAELVAARDAAERAREELALVQRRLQNALGGAQAAMWEWTMQTGELVVDERWTEMVGYTIAELAPIDIHTFERLIHPYDLEPTFACTRRYLSGESPTYEAEFRLAHKDGHWVWIVSRGAVMTFDAHGRPLSMCGTHLDITERKRAQEEAAEMERRVQQAQKLESLGVLAGGIAHDFNNILTSILGNATLAQDELSPLSPARDRLAEIETAATRASELCLQMLAYAGRGNLSREPLALGDLVSEMVHLLRLSIPRNVLLNLNLDKNLPRMEGDATQLRQVLMNLVINASEAIGERSGVISITTGAVQGTQAYLAQFCGYEELPEGLYVSLEVSDTGCGMTADVVARLFEPFFTTKFQGRGLGMSAVLGIMKSHHGALKVYTEPGKGTTFRLIFPALEGHAGLAPARQEPAGPAPARKARVLLVDDDETVRAVGAAMLKRLGYEVLAAEDGLVGLEAYRREAGTIDLVVLDLTMPRMDGEATFRALRAEFPAATVVITSVYSQHDVSARFAGKGVAGFLQKPFSMDLLRKVLGPLTQG